MIEIPEGITQTDVIIAIEERILGLHAERNKKILYQKLIVGATFEEIADDFQLSERRIKDIVYKGCNTIFSHIHRK